MVTVETISDYDSFLKAAPFWDRLVDKSGDSDIPFLTFDWLRLWWRMFGKGKRLFILVLRQDGEPVAAVPLMKELAFWRGMPVRSVSSLANDQSCRTGIIGDDSGIRDALAVVFRHLLDSRVRFDMMRLNYLPEESDAGRQLDRILPEFGLAFRKLPGSLSPYIPIRGNWEEFLKSRSRNLRDKIKRTANNLSRGNRHSLSLIVSEGVEEAMEKVIEISRNTWKYRERTAIASDPRTAEFYRQYAEYAGGKRLLKLMLLEYDAKPVAFTYELKYKGRDYFIKTGFDERYTRLSPGIFILGASIREAYESGCLEYDLLGTNEEYKMRFADLIRPHSKYWIFNNGAYGRLLKTLEAEAIPLLKRLTGGKKRGEAYSATRTFTARGPLGDSCTSKFTV